jgi:hypothetical protein
MKKINLFESLKAKGVTFQDGEEKMLNELSTELNAAFDAAKSGTISADDAQKQVDAAIKALPTQFSAKSITIPGTAVKGADGVMGADATLDEFLRTKATEIGELQRAAKTAPSVNPVQAQAETIKSLVAEVKKAKASGVNGQFFISADKAFDSNDRTDKAAVTMTTGGVNANASGVTVPANYLYGVEATANPDVRIDPYVTQFVDNGSTDMAAIPYMDKLPTQGTMAITAEGALKPLLSWTNERRFTTAFKIAGRTKVTEEALDDVPGLQAQANNELRYSHDIAEQNAIYAHVASFAPAFVAGDLAASTKLPSNWDAIRAAVYAVKIASKGRFIPNAAVINSADAYAMGATKDTAGQYVIPTFVLPDGTKVSGVRVVETQDDTNVAAGTMIVGDWRKIKRRVYKPFNLRMGQGINGSSTAANITSDFETNQYTFIGESRLHLWHYKNDETAFIKSTFAAIKTAIVL